MTSSVKKAVGLTVVLALIAMPLVSVAAEHIVQVVGIQFVPQNITVPQGDTIRWVNNSGLYHTVTSGLGCAADGLFNMSLPDLTEVTYTFDNLGTFDYFCIPHCLANMIGQVTVEAPVPVRASTWGAIKALYQAR